MSRQKALMLAFGATLAGIAIIFGADQALALGDTVNWQCNGVSSGCPAGLQYPLPTAPPGAGSWANITSNGNTLVATGRGWLGKICLNTAGATGNTAKLYDGTDNTGRLIATIDTTSLAGRCEPLEVNFKTGLFVVTATGTAADLTVTFSQ